MSEQTILPFPNLNIPARHARWLLLANAASYPEKHFWFYPLKSKILRDHAIMDGFDLQIITKKCWCGDGIWRGRDDTLPKVHWQQCHKCSGTGIYLEKKVLLERWLINGVILHCPSTFIPNAELHKFKETFEGLIQHPPVDEKTGRRAMQRLLLRYWRAQWIAYCQNRWRTFLWKKQNAWRAQIRHINRILRIFRNTEPVEDDELPF